MVVSKSKLHTFHQIVTLKRRQTFCFDRFPASIPNGPINALVFVYVLIFAENVTGFSFKVWLKRINALFLQSLGVRIVRDAHYIALVHWLMRIFSYSTGLRVSNDVLILREPAVPVTHS